MPDILQLGPFLLKTEWLVIFVSALCGYFVLKYRLRLSQYPHQISDTIENGLLLALALWKFSLILFNPVRVVANPISLLYFSGGVRGFWLGVIVAILYFYYRARKDRISYWVYADLLAVGYLASMIVFNSVSLLLAENMVWTYLSQALIFLAIILAVFLRTKLSDQPYYLTQVLLWLSLARVFSAFLDPLKENVVWGFSKEQVLFVFLALLSLAAEVITDKKTHKS